MRVSLHFLPGVAARAALLFALALLIIGGGLVLGACSTAPPVVLSGTITDAYTGNPVSAANVQIGNTELSTDDGGNFSTPRWSEDDTLQVSAPGYEPLTLPLDSQPDLAATATPTVTFQATIRPNTLSGTITDAFTGQPIAGAQLQISENVSPTLTVTTDASGAYRIEGVPEAFALAISAPDYAPLTIDLGRTTVHDATLRPNVLSGIVTDRFSNAPIAGATVQVGGASATTDAEGRYRVSDIPADATAVEISAEGYASLTQPIEQTTSIDAVLRPDVLTAQLTDQASGEPVVNATILATTTMDGDEVAFTRMRGSGDGEFTLSGLPETGYLQILAPGYRKHVIEIEPGNIPTQIALEPFDAKGVYITSAVASLGLDYVGRNYFDYIDNTELNAIVIDLKSDLRDDLGLIYYDSNVPIVQELGTSANYVDMAGLVAEAKRRGIYTIARIHIFHHDNVLAQARPDWAVTDRETGGVFAVYPAPTIRYDWLDPWNREVWDYNIQIGIEAARMGFDEINFDFIRFPDVSVQTYRERMIFSQPTDPAENPEAMYQNIVDFLEVSHRAINGAGAFFSVDVFGYTTLRPMWEIGQDINRISNHADFVAPMIYPSHYAFGEFGFDDPAEHPYEIIFLSVERGHELMEGTFARMRPWLQDFTLIWRPPVVRYGAPEVRAQIDAVEDHGLSSGWLLWDADNQYDYDALKPAE